MNKEVQGVRETWSMWKVLYVEWSAKAMMVEESQGFFIAKPLVLTIQASWPQTTAFPTQEETASESLIDHIGLNVIKLLLVINTLSLQNGHSYIASN